MGFPSYAQPIIGEWEVILSNWPLSVSEKLSFSKELAKVCEYPKTLKFNEFSLEVKLKLPNLFSSFNVKLLTLPLNTLLEPLGLIWTSVVKLLYPIPELTTIASTILPPETTGLILAPDPEPVSVTITSGAEKYSRPWFTTAALSIFPLAIIGLISPDSPVRISIFGVIWWFKIVEPKSLPLS